MIANRFIVHVAHDLSKDCDAYEIEAHSIALTPTGALEIKGESGRQVIPASSWRSVTVLHAEAAAEERPQPPRMRGAELHGVLAGAGLIAWDFAALLAA